MTKTGIGAQWPIEMDEALVGGQTRGEGKGSHHMTYVVGAVKVRQKQDKCGRRAIFAGRFCLSAFKDRSKRLLAAMGCDHESVVLHGDTEKSKIRCQ